MEFYAEDIMWLLQLEKKNQITKQIIFVSAPPLVDL